MSKFTADVRARVAVTFLFVFTGAATTSWAVHIPVVKEHFNLSNAQVGWVIMMLGLGAVTSMQFMGHIVDKRGSKFGTVVAGSCASVAVILPGLATNVYMLCAALFVFGFFLSATDVSMNAQAVELEKRYGRPIFSAFHAYWSIGCFIGATLGGAALAAGWPSSRRSWPARAPATKPARSRQRAQPPQPIPIQALRPPRRRRRKSTSCPRFRPARPFRDAHIERVPDRAGVLQHQRALPWVEGDEQGGIGPGVAERWERSVDGRSWTFFLRKGLRFHNGDPVTAHDVKFSLERQMGPGSLASAAASMRRTMRLRPECRTISTKLSATATSFSRHSSAAMNPSSSSMPSRSFWMVEFSILPSTCAK